MKRYGVKSSDGSVIIDHNSIQFKDASTLTLYLTTGTDYYGDDPEKMSLKRQQAIKEKSYEEIKTTHISDFNSFYNRVDMNLGKESNPAAIPTDEQIELELKQGHNPLLAYQVFQISRYNIISSSRKGTMPAHLHCLWNRQFDPTYNCAYIINVNVQLNYSIAEPGNLSELHRPLFDFLDRLRPNGRKTARDVYNCNGFVVHHNVDGTLMTGPMFKMESAFWPMGAGWLCQNLWEHYLHTYDNDWLKKQGYPILKEAARFFYDYLMVNPDTGKLIFGPSTSPENRYLMSDGNIGHVMTGIAMDQQIVYDHFQNTIEAAQILKDKDTFISQLKKALNNLEKPRIGKDGRILEWRRPLKEEQPYHRHVSHLYGTYPASLYTQDKEQELFKAAIKSLDIRWQERYKPNRKGKKYIGPAWATVINMPMYARYRQPKSAYAMYKKVFENGYVRKTLMGTLNPKDNIKAHGIYLDSNSGTSIGMIETIMQSHRGFIEFLPALPVQWKDGYFKGIKARGGFVIDLIWKDGTWTKAVIKSIAGRKLRMAAKNNVEILKKGKKIEFSRDPSDIIELKTNKGEIYTALNK